MGPEPESRASAQGDAPVPAIGTVVELLALLECMPDALVAVNGDGRIVAANTLATELFGYAADELAGSPIELLVPERLREAHVRHRTGYTAAPRPRPMGIGLELIARRRDGSEFPATISLSPCPIGGSTLTLGAVRDVTERHRSEDALRRSEGSLARAQAIAHIGSWDWDIVTGRLEWSDEIYRIFGLAPQEFGATYDAFLAYVNPEDRDSVQHAVNAAVHKRLPYSIEHRIVRPDGSERTVHEQGEVSYDGNGLPVRMIGTVQDITERALAERALRDSEKRYRDLYENASDIIYSNDLEGRFLAFNPAGERILGYRREELLGQHFAVVVAPEHVEPTLRQMRRKLAGDTDATTYEVELVRKDGTRVPVEISSRVVFAHGRPVGVEGVAREITERRRAEQARRELEEQLRHTQKLEALGRLAGGVAHDFNNLLTAIVGYSQLLADRAGADPELRRDIDEILRAADRGAGLTRQLLAFGRRQVLQPRVLDLNEVVRETGGLIRRVIGESVELELSLAPRLGRVYADRSQLEQVLLNLSVNARDAMPAGGTVMFETENVRVRRDRGTEDPQIEPGDYVRLSVRDTGTGIAPEVREHLFEPFFTTKAPGEGTGLGLATVLGIVEQSGGTIAVESDLGAGATFRIYLPRVRAKTEPAPAAAPGESGGAEPSGSETVLVAEDDQTVRNLTRRVLERAGYTVLTARDGAEALEVCRTHAGPIHLLVTDVVMPRLSGPELAREALEIRPDMPVIYTSGYAETAFGADRMLPRGTDFLPKPFTGSTIARKVREVLDRAR